jgi:lysophospholipase L1-like esterase
MTVLYDTDPRAARARGARRRLAAAAVGAALGAWVWACGGSPTAPSPPPLAPAPEVPGPPTIACPADVVTQSPDGRDVAIDLAPPVTTGGAAPVAVSCDAPTVFPLGTTTVSCTAKDALERTATCTFRVQVLPPPVIRYTRYLAFGDSLTAGEVSPAPSVRFLSPTDAYPYRLQALLQSRYRTQAILVVNDGVPGEAATEGGLERFSSELLQHRPEVVLIMEGTNDLITRTPDRIVLALDGMVRDAVDRGFVPVLATIPPARSSRRDPAAIALLNELVRDVARRRQVTLADVYAAMDLSMIGMDGLHPTPYGYEVMAQTFYQALVAAFELPSHPGARQ